MWFSRNGFGSRNGSPFFPLTGWLNVGARSLQEMTEKERAKLEMFLQYVDKEEANGQTWPAARDGRSVHFRFGRK